MTEEEKKSLFCDKKTAIKTFLYHLLFWIVYTLIFTFVEGGYQNQFREAFLIEIAHLPVRLVIIYFNYFYLLPTYLEKGRYTSYILLTSLTLLSAAFLQRFFMGAFFNPIIFPGWDGSGTFAWFRVLQAGIIIASPLIFIIGFTVISRWATLNKQAEELRREKKEAELSLLKNQINPHFFFNTLNNLYGLTQEKSDLAEQIILKLSDLMSYVLYETDQRFVPVDKEISYIKNYIELEEIRYDARFNCNFSLSGNINDKLIPPMIFLPFVENAFKHGVNQDSKNTWVNINISAEDDIVSFFIENGVPEVSNKKTVSNTPGGIGIKNVERRLSLLYPENHVLDYKSEEDSFRVYLKIPFEYEEKS